MKINRSPKQPPNYPKQENKSEKQLSPNHPQQLGGLALDLEKSSPRPKRPQRLGGIAIDLEKLGNDFPKKKKKS